MLRARIESLFEQQRQRTLAKAAAATKPSWAMRIASINWRLSGAAAAVVLSLGFMFYSIRQTFFPEFMAFAQAAPRVRLVSQFPISFAMEMVKTHDHCARLADHHLLPSDNFESLRVQLAMNGGVDPFAQSIGDGWKFKGAGKCKVGSIPAAHLMFTRGDRTVSVFSMLVPQGCGEGSEFRQSVDNHAIRAFRNGEALYVVVASSPANAVGCEELNARASEAFSAVKKCIAPGTCGAAHPASSPAKN